MKVKCINNEFVRKSLTIDKIYPVIEEKEHHYEIFDNDNEKNTYKKTRFVAVDENKCINTRIRCINNYLNEKYLSKDKIYTVLEEKGDYYVIYDDSKKVNNWSKHRFVPAEENTIIGMAKEIAELVKNKDKDYNSTFVKTLQEYGQATYFLRVDDKLNRVKSLLLNNKDTEVNESVEDTLKDIVVYTLLMLKEIKNRRSKNESNK